MRDVGGPIDEAEVRHLVDEADLPSLLAALACLQKDPALVPPDLRLDPDSILDPLGGWDESQRRQGRDLAVDALTRHLATGADTALSWSRDRLAPIVRWLSGADLADDYVDMLLEELAIDGDRRAPAWSASDLDGRPPHVLIIGAGMSGILAAHRLEQAAVPYTVIDKNADVGGTWLENDYPGCRVDVFNHVYAYSGEQRPDWPSYHSSQRVLLDYFRDCADRWGIRRNIRFGVEAESMSWDEASATWQVVVRGDSVATLTADVVVSAVGQLNRPLLPDIPGRDLFSGPSFHSARWRHDLDFRGRRVAVIGTGASAMQFIPHVAEQAEELVVFQRTPAWLIPRPEYHEPLPSGLLRLFREVPGYPNWFRLRQFWRTHEGVVGALRRDPSWDGPVEQAVSARNDEIRHLLTLYMEHEFSDRPDLIPHVLPRYPVGAKRIVLDNGIWARTLGRPNVRLVTEGIREIVPTGVVTEAGETIDSDVLIYGSGFRASEFLAPMSVKGRSGADLHRDWSGDARAYLGMTVPGFPNLFFLYGPNTNIVINGSIIYFSECEVHYLLEAVRLLMTSGHRSMECRPDVYEEYVQRVDAANSEMVWGISGVNSWYKSRSGGVAQNWPFPLIDYWRQTRHARPEDYITE